MADDTITVPVRMNPTRELARRRFAELQELKAIFVAELQPFRDDYERLTNDPRLIECRAKIKEMNGKIGPVDNELADLSKLLGGKSLHDRG